MKKLRLTKRDLNILHDAHTFGLVVPELIAPYRFADKGPAAVTSTLRRLYGAPPHYRYLRPEPLDARRVYYRLTGKGAATIGVSRGSLRRLGMQSLIRRYAMTWLICAEGTAGRRLLERDRLRKLLPDLNRINQMGFFLEPGDRLGNTIVDHGADPTRVVRRVACIAQRMLEHPATAPFVASGRLSLVLLTFDERKRETLDEAVRKRLTQQLRTPLWRLGRQAQLPLTTYCVPGLAPLVLHNSL